jgi:hypothetical protein
MAKTSRKRVEVAAGRQAPAGVWTPDTLLSALRNRTDDERIEALKSAGIIDAEGNLTKTYESWGTKVTRTPDAQG